VLARKCDGALRLGEVAARDHELAAAGGDGAGEHGGHVGRVDVLVVVDAAVHCVSQVDGDLRESGGLEATVQCVAARGPNRHRCISGLFSTGVAPWQEGWPSGRLALVALRRTALVSLERLTCWTWGLRWAGRSVRVPRSRRTQEGLHYVPAQSPLNGLKAAREDFNVRRNACRKVQKLCRVSRPKRRRSIHFQRWVVVSTPCVRFELSRGVFFLVRFRLV